MVLTGGPTYRLWTAGRPPGEGVRETTPAKARLASFPRRSQLGHSATVSDLTVASPEATRGTDRGSASASIQTRPLTDHSINRR